MSLPLATLRRHATRVVLSDRFAGGWPANLEGAAPVAFVGRGDAVTYLRFWKSDAAAMAGLRDALYRYRHAPISRWSDDDVLERLAVHLDGGELVLFAENPILPRSPWRRGLSAAAAAAGAAPPAAPAPPATPPVRLLPKLEKVQIEGAKVLPEVLQTLEQLDLTLAEIDAAAVSLEPAPAGIAPIDSALREASGSITATLDGL